MFLEAWDDGVATSAAATLTVSSAYLIAEIPARTRIRRAARRRVGPATKLAVRAASLVGLCLASAPAAARQVIPAPWKEHPPATAPWSEPGPSLPPPPDGFGKTTVRHSVPPVLHPGTSAAPPRPGTSQGRARKHPKEGVASARRYTVQPGDSLWRIAEAVLRTRDNRAIAAYWPRIFRLNREVVGRDPNLIVPGQVLVLPDKRATE